MLTNVLWALGAKKGNFENNCHRCGANNRQGLWSTVGHKHVKKNNKISSTLGRKRMGFEAC